MRHTFKQLVTGVTLWSFMTASFAQATFLSQLQGAGPDQAQGLASIRATNPTGGVAQNYVSPKPAAAPAGVAGEFAQYVEGLTGDGLKRFGSELVKDGDQTFSPPATAAIPGDYQIGPGDEMYVRTWGSIDADLRLVVDRNGQVNIPKVGTVSVSGVPYSELNRVLQQAIGKTYSGVNVSATMGQLRGIRVYVTGYAQNPGAYTVNNLSSLIIVVMASGGPANAGSFRNIQLKRGGKLISSLDLYDLLLKGDKSGDRPVVSEDVIYVGPAGAQVAVTGAVNKAAIYEVKANESLADVMAYAGGFVSGAKVDTINYLSLAGRRDGFKELPQTAFASKKIEDGDVYMALSDVAVRQPIDKQARVIRIDGQVNKPGVYVLKPGSTLNDAINVAGGLTAGAYLFGVRLERVSTKAEQTKTLDRFKREARRNFSNDAIRKQTTAEDAAIMQASQQRAAIVLSALEEIKPDGRLALSLKPSDTRLPDFVVESGDVLTIPSVPSTVGVMGSIAGGQVSLAYRTKRTVSDYIESAGGYSQGADKSNVYVMRASGEFIANKGWFSNAGSLDVMPGDSIFVPEDLQKTTFTKELKDWTQILYQLGLGAAAIKVLKN